jgi:tRNA dimethylallyltransferase
LAPLPALIGPTASGKTEAAIDIARELGAEIVSVDSMLVYRGMDVGTAKPSADQLARVPHHMIDVADPGEAFSVARFRLLGRQALADVASRGVAALLVGGSGLYLRALVDDLSFPGTDPWTREQLEREAVVVGPRLLHERLADFDPVAADKIEPGNVRRTIRALEVAAVTGREFSSFSGDWDIYPTTRVRAAGILMSREDLTLRIRGRVLAMLDAGIVDEVRSMLDRGYEGWIASSRVIGYTEFARHIRGSLTLDEALELTIKRTRSLARRQMAWFRRDPRIVWFEVGAEGASGAFERVLEFLRSASPAA